MHNTLELAGIPLFSSLDLFSDVPVALTVVVFLNSLMSIPDFSKLTCMSASG